MTRIALMSRDEQMASMCPCETGVTYGECCAVIHRDGAGVGTSAESLMRARYTAYVLCKQDFLLESWHPRTRPAAVQFEPAQTWLGLDVDATEGGSPFQKDGVVQFRARFMRAGEVFELHERSNFGRHAGRWVYIDGSSPE